MQELIFMIGLPASGKSTVAENYKSQYVKVHSSDLIRVELFDDISNQENNDKVFQELYKRARLDLLEGYHVVIDATNLVSKRRIHGLNSIFQKGLDRSKVKVIAELVLCPYNECLDRNKARDRKVPVGVIENMYKSFQVPVLGEGFDEIRLNYTSDVKYNASDILYSLYNIDQHNENHTLTIGQHCYAVSDILLQSNESFALIKAGYLHDIGKKFCMSFKDSYGRLSSHAHFYNHENCSAYDSFFIKDDIVEENLKVAQLINYHMMPHVCNTEKSINKRIKLLGEELWDDILKLHEADKKGR